MKKVNVQEKFEMFSDHWNPRIVGELNGQQVKLAKLKGEFIWHHHKDTDETFIVLEGTLHIALRDRVVVLQKGELFVVPKDTEHKPYADEECHLLLIEPKHVVNTGERTTELTAPNNEWI